MTSEEPEKYAFCENETKQNVSFHVPGLYSYCSVDNISSKWNQGDRKTLIKPGITDLFWNFWKELYVAELYSTAKFMSIFFFFIVFGF